MRVVELPAVGAPLQMAERPLAEPGPDQVRVRIQACGVCGSDLFLQKGGFGAEKLPRVPGHEAAGVVDRLGPGVTSVREGDQVALYYIEAPRESRYAAAGRGNVGPHVSRMGVDVDGAFAEYVVRREDTLIVPRAPVDPAILAALTDAVATPYHALTRIARVQPGETVVVLGIGGVGSNAVQIAKLLGARVIAISRSESKLDLARRLGADEVVRSEKGVADAIAHLTGEDGPEVVLQCAGSAELDQLAIEVAGFMGRVVFVGTGPDPFSCRASTLVWRELTFLGSRGFTPQDIRAVIDLYLDGKLEVGHLVERTRPLTEANEAFADLAAGRVLRTVLIP